MRTSLCCFVLLLPFCVRAQGWTEIGNGPGRLNPNAHITGICTDSKNNLYVSGFFAHPSGYRDVYKWDGETWSIVGGSNGLYANGVIYALCVDKDDNLYAGGFFQNGGYRYVARWDGLSWQPLGTGNNALNAASDITWLGTDKAGNLYTCALYAGPSSYYFAIWEGSTWRNVNLPNFAGISVTPEGKGYSLYSTWNGTIATSHLSFWDRSSWNTLTPSLPISMLCTDRLGNAYCVEDTGINRRISIWNGLTRLKTIPLTDNGSYTQLQVKALCTDRKGNLYLAGDGFNGQWRNYIARWDGHRWTELLNTDGSPLKAYIAQVIMCVDDRDQLYLSGWVSAAQGTYCVFKYTPPPDCHPYVYPNPALSQIHVACLPPGTVVSLMDISERVLFTGLLGRDNILDVGHLPPGVYFLKSKKGSVKFIKL